LESRDKQAELESIPAKINALSPRDSLQRSQQAHALTILSQLSNTRFENIVQIGANVPRPLLIVLLFWLAMLLMGFGLFSPRHLTAVVGLCACALCLAGAIVVLIDLD